MASDGKVLIRPRNIGEVLDDAWRLYLSDAPLLLALSGLFTVPVAVALLLLLTRPQPANVALQLVLPAVTAVLLPLTGLGSGACQEVFRRRAEGRAVTLGGCLHAALRRGLDHITARALVLAATFLGLWCLVLPGLAVWIGASSVHPALAAGEGRLFEALALSIRDTSRTAGKAMAVTLCRLPLFVVAFFNLYLLGGLCLKAADLAGLDTALAALLFSLGNSVCFVGLVLLTWVLLTPFAEASCFLLHADTRARYEGLDLWYRVQELLPVVGGTAPTPAPAGPAPAGGARQARGAALLLALGSTLALAAPAQAAPEKQQLPAVKKARQDVDAIRQEVEQAKPYPGGRRWLPQLRRVAAHLDPAGSATRGPYRWFYHALADFGEYGQEDASRVLAGLSRQLAAAEDALSLAPRDQGPATPEHPAGERPARSPEEIKQLWDKAQRPGDKDAAPGGEVEKETLPEDRPQQHPEEEQPEPKPGPQHHGPGAIPPHPGGGLGIMGWVVLGGLLLAVLAVACVFLLRQRGEQRPTQAPRTGKEDPGLEDVLTQPQHQAVAALWRQADQLAKKGEFLAAVRTLYLAVLAQLHRGDLVRYEPMRTNGEYLDQLRANAKTPETLLSPFQRLTRLFEQKWYGERACRPEDYDTCRGLAEEIRGLV